jgi:hypothetical protein
MPIDLAKNWLGYALPEAALALIATSRHTLRAKRLDRVFFPEEDRHVKDATRGHICRVRMRIGRNEGEDADEDADGRPVWIPMDKPCASQMTGHSYRRHLFEKHLAMPRLVGKRVKNGTATIGELIMHESRYYNSRLLSF